VSPRREITVCTDYKSPYAFLANAATFALAEEMYVTLVWRPYVLDIPKYLDSARVDAAGNVREEDRNAINGGGFVTATWTLVHLYFALFCNELEFYWCIFRAAVASLTFR
jgi:hypothetical protein